MYNRAFDDYDILIGILKDVGWFYLAGNAKARKATEAIFPSCPIAWDTRSETAFPPDWETAEINLPKLIATCPNNKLVRLTSNPDRSLNIYGQCISATLVVAGCRVVIRDAAGKFHAFIFEKPF